MFLVEEAAYTTLELERELGPIESVTLVPERRVARLCKVPQAPLCDALAKLPTSAKRRD